MLKRTLELPTQSLIRIFFLLLLISCKTSAVQPLSHNDFDAFLRKAEFLIDSDPKAALFVLNPHQDEVKNHSITSQVNFYRIQSKAYLGQAQYTLSNSSADIGLKLTKKMNSPSIFIAELTFTKGFALESLGDLDGAFQHYQNGLDMARSLKQQEFIAQGLINIGAVYYLRNNYKQSLISLNQALNIAISIKDEALLGYVNSELGILYIYLKEEDKAIGFFKKSYQHYKKAGKHNKALESLDSVAINYVIRENYDEAIKVAKKLEREIKDNTRSEFVAGIYITLANAFSHKDELDNAYHYIELAGKHIADVEYYTFKLDYRIEKANVLIKMGRYQEALINIEQAEKLLQSNVGDSYNAKYLKILKFKYKLYYSIGNYRQAYSMQEQYFTQALNNREYHDTAEIDELRLQYESDTSERQKSILEQQQSIQNVQLHQLTQEGNNRKLFSVLLVVCILLLALTLYRVIRGQQDVVNAKRTDELTGVINRRGILKVGYQYFNEAKTQQKPLSVCMIDIDCFKEINHKLGHFIGDGVLQQIANHGQAQMREQDVFGRFGSKQFIVLLPTTEHSEAFDVAQRLKEDIETIKWQMPELLPLTVSVGVSTYEHKNYDNFNELVKAADDQLLHVKSLG